MLVLAISACLASDPNRCRDFEVELQDVTKMQCMYASQFVVASWIAEHPGYAIKSMACVPKSGKA